MIKVALDTNILLDAVLNRPERDAALKILLAVEKYILCISIHKILFSDIA